MRLKQETAVGIVSILILAFAAGCQKKARVAMDSLTQSGVPAARLIEISCGKERPEYTESNETCWQKNRRVHFVPEKN